MNRILVIVFLLSLQSVNTSQQNSSQPMNIVYTIDTSSYSYFILSIASIAKYHYGTRKQQLQQPYQHHVFNTNRSIIQIHVIIATGSNQEYSLLVKKINSFFQCYQTLQWKSYQYYDPNHYTSLMKPGKPHWLSTTEKLRNYIPEIIPDLERYIYFDNDVIITKQGILYYLWKQDLKGSPLGIVGCSS